LIPLSCLLSEHCFNLASVSHGKINVNGKSEAGGESGSKENKENLIQNTGYPAKIQTVYPLNDRNAATVPTECD
jgi:hypothetical protein